MFLRCPFGAATPCAFETEHGPPPPCPRDLNLDLAQWQPIVEDRGLVPWLVKQPGEQDLLRARHLTLAQVGGAGSGEGARPPLILT